MSVLDAQPPHFSADEVARITYEVFGFSGTATDLGSERDQTFLVSGEREVVVKISNLGEEAAVLDLEREATLHVRRVDPELPVAEPIAAAGTYQSGEGAHHVRLFNRMEGRHAGPELGDRGVYDFAATHARLTRALRSFFHPAAGRDLLWDLKQTPRLRPLLANIGDPWRRQLVARVLDRFASRAGPRWGLLRSQVVHGDFNLDNVLLGEDERVSGIVDFGDCGYSALVADLAIAIASLMRGRQPEDAFRVARIAVDGFSSELPLEPVELELLGDLVAARLAMIVAISAWRVQRYPENAEYIQAWDDDSWALLEHFDSVGFDRVADEIGAPLRPAPTPDLVRRRAATMGGLLTRLTYTRPVHVVRGQGVWLYEADGGRLLDAYNNVPVVGHAQPRVSEAVARQTRTLNTHARYLYEPLIDLAERLLATMPPGSGLDTVMLVNSGSEANDLAWRLACGGTGRRGGIVTRHAYHGVTHAIADLSPEEWPEGFRPRHVGRIAPPGSGVDVEAEMRRALAELGELGLAATLVDCAFTSDGVYTPPASELEVLLRQTHEAGGLLVADEVQAGHGRLGAHLWAFAQYGLRPDVVTLGKPMGNGYPVAAVVTRGDLAERFPYAGRTFSTFGGNPVAAAAALAVLDVIADERLVENAARVGGRLLRLLRKLGDERIVEVRGSGLMVGVQVDSPSLAGRLVDSLRDLGILIGRTGPADDVLKIRPPLVFADEHADLLVGGLERALATVS